MKPAIYITLLGVVIIVFSVISLNSMKKTADRVDSQVQTMEYALHQGDWEAASSILEEVNTQWEKTKKNWAALIDHIEIDNIDMSLSRVERYLDTKDYSPLLAEIAVLRMYVKHIPDKEEVNISNIF